MTDDFSFRSLVPPGVGAERAMGRTLGIWLSREVPLKRPHWVYAGVADLLLQHGTFFGGRDLPERWDHVRGPGGHCHHNSLDAAEAEPELRYYTGLYMVGRMAQPHSWCVDGDGLVCELTFPDQRLIDADGGPNGSLVDEFGRQTGIPWLPPSTWSYVGVEYSVAFVREHGDVRGLPLLDPLSERTFPFGLGCYEPDEDLPMWATPYSIDGWPVPPKP